MTEAVIIITLITEDGQRINVDLQCAQQIGILRPMLNFNNTNTTVATTTTFPLPAVKSTTLAKVVEFLNQHREDSITKGGGTDIIMHSPSKKLPKKDTPKDYDTSSESEDNDSEAGFEGLGRLENIQTPNSSDSSDDEEYIYEDYLANVTPWDQKFLDSLDLPSLIELTKAANYLNIPTLLDLCCRTIAKQMTGLKAEELRKKFNLPNDFTPEEEAKMAAEFAWIEE